MSYYGPQQQYPPQQYQQVPPPQQQPGYGPYYGPPKPASFLSNPKVIAGMVLGIIGGIMLIIGPFINFLSGCVSGGCLGLSLNNPYVPAELLYGYVIPIAGILVLVFAIIAPFGRKKQFATLTFVFGLLGMIISIVVLVHGMARAEAFGMGFGYWGVSVAPGVGFFLAVIGGALGLTAGLLHKKEIAQLPAPPPAAQVPPTAPPYGQPPLQQHPPQQYPPQYP